MLKSKTIENHFKTISITGRLAFAIKCLEQYIKEQQLESTWLDRLIELLWDFTTSEDLGKWDKKISDLDPNNIIDKHPDNKASDYDSLTEAEFNELKKYYTGISDALSLLIDLTIDIGTSNLYGGTGEYSKYTLESTLRVYWFAKENITKIPDINTFKISPYSEGRGWGNSIEKSAFD